MAHSEFSLFSPDNSFLAVCGEDGKLRIYESLTNRLKLEYLPNSHLASPCSALTWIKTTSQTNNALPSPWKKRKRKSISEDAEQKYVVAMGSVNGTVSLYDISSAHISAQLQDGHNSTVTALSWSASVGLFTAAEDKQIIQWNLHDNSIKSKWKTGKGKITAIAILPGGASLLTADRVIKWWDLSTKQVLQTFTSHSSQITCLNTVKISDEVSLLITCCKNDAYLTIWQLNEVTKENDSIATLITQDEPKSLSVRSYKNDQIMILTTTTAGQAHLFKYQSSDTNSKPLKPTLTVMVLSDSKKELVQQIPILMSNLTVDAKVMLAYGSYIYIHFETVAPDFSDKTQCLIRSEYKKVKERKDEMLPKIKDTENDVEYLIPGSTVTGIKRSSKFSTGSQLPLKDRLENLSLDVDKNISDKIQTKGDSLVHLLIQGLQSNEKSILETVFRNKKQNVINSTVAKLPVQAIVPLLKELTAMLQGKTYTSKVATWWLTALITTHAGQLMSHPDIVDALTPILSFIDTKLKLLSEISKLRGRVNLITGQISNSQKTQINEEEEALLVYQDLDSSEEDTDIGEVETSSESDDNWEELSNLVTHSEDENIKSDDNVSMCS